MANISQLIMTKSARDQDRTETRQAERDNLSAMRDTALLSVVASPEQYQRFLNLQGDNISCSAGNVALTMIQLPEATKIGTTDFWHSQNRRVMDEAMSKGADVFVPSRNAKYRGYFMGKYYDVSQTTGKPIKEQTALTDNSPRMETALAALMDSSPVGIVSDKELDIPAYYDAENIRIVVNPAYSDTEVFAALATEITYAKFHDRGYNADYRRESFSIDAESVGYMICRRFGVDAPLPDADRIAVLYDGYNAGEIGEALERLRQSARNVGDSIDRTISPHKQEPQRRTHGAR